MRDGPALIESKYMKSILRLMVVFLLAGMSSWLIAQERTDQFFDSNGVRLRYIEQGSGDPVVLIHGFGGSADEPWVTAGIFQALAKNYRVIAIDCRGFGKSDKPSEIKQYGQEMAWDVVRLLDHLKIPRAHIVGYSMGAAITAKLVTMKPERFLSATLGGYGARLSWLAAAKNSRQDDATYEQRAVELENGPDGRTNPNAIARAAALRSFREQRVTAAEVSAIKVPVISIIGTADEGLAAARELKRMMPDLKFVTIAGANHDSARRRPEFLKAVEEFLQVNSPSK